MGGIIECYSDRSASKKPRITKSLNEKVLNKFKSWKSQIWCFKINDCLYLEMNKMLKHCKFHVWMQNMNVLVALPLASRGVQEM